MFERVLVPLDGSRLSEKALPVAGEIAKRFGSELVLVRAVSQAPVHTGFSQESAQAMQILMEQARSAERQSVGRARRYLTLKEQKLARDGIKVIKRAVIGAPAPVILAEARRAKAGLVVMTTRGRGGLRRALMGSVTDEIVRSPQVAVLVVTPGRRGSK